MLTFAKIGLVGLVLLSSKMANANQLQEDYRCNADAKQPAECNPLTHFCNKWGWCELHKKDDDDINDKKKKKPRDETHSDDDVTDTPSTTSDCQSVICIDYTKGARYHAAYTALADIYRYNTKFVIEEEGKNGRHLYKGIAKDDEKKKPKYAIWWKKGLWMVGEYDKRNTLTAFAVAKSSEECPEKINYDWRYYYSYENAFKTAGEGMSVYGEC